MRSKWLIVGIVAILLVLLGPGLWRGFSETFNPGASIGKADLQATKDYYNPTERVKFKHPNSWKVTYNDSSSPIKYVVAKDEEASLMFVSETLNVPTTTMAKYTADSLKVIKAAPGYLLLEEKDVEINDQTFHKIVYKSAADGKNIVTAQIWTIKNGKGYGFTYNSQENSHTKYLPQANDFFESIEIF